MKKEKIKAIALFSGGLDSILAAKLILEQDINLEGVNFVSVFYSSPRQVKSAAFDLGLKLKILEINKEFFKVLINPKHGYGSKLNPCIDCHILMLKKAADYMRKTGAKFLVTGEVVGERPMSQNKSTLRRIEKESGLEGLILRPLSAKILEPTVPEKKAWVDREELLAITGRGRKTQIELAKKFGIYSYPAPAGGCLLTDAAFSNKMRDLMRHKKNFTVEDVEFLKLGRYFRLGGNTEFIVGRNEKENNKLSKLAAEGDYRFYPVKVKGPVGIGRGIFDEESILTASGIMARYCDRDLEEKVKIVYKKLPARAGKFVITAALSEEKLNLLRI